MPKLSAASLPLLAADVPGPAYDGGSVAVGIVHLGVGGFHRAQQAMYVDPRRSAGTPGHRLDCRVPVRTGGSGSRHRADGIPTPGSCP